MQLVEISITPSRTKFGRKPGDLRHECLAIFVVENWSAIFLLDQVWVRPLICCYYFRGQHIGDKTDHADVTPMRFIKRFKLASGRTFQHSRKLIGRHRGHDSLAAYVDKN